MPKKPGDIKISREQQNAVQEMQTAVMNKLTLGLNNYPETQKLFNRLGYASNFANAISADDAYDIEDNMDKLQQDGGLIAALTQPVPWGDGSTSFYQYLTQNDLELKAKIDNGLKALNDIADFKWNLDFKPIQVNQDISELSGGRTAPGYNAPQKDAGEIINDLRDSLNIPRTQERQQGAMERRRSLARQIQIWQSIQLRRSAVLEISMTGRSKRHWTNSIPSACSAREQAGLISG